MYQDLLIVLYSIILYFIMFNISVSLAAVKASFVTEELFQC